MLEASTYPEVKGPIVTVGTAPRLQYQRLPGDAPAQISPNAALGVIAAGAVAVIALWWQDTATVHSLGDWLTNAGRITGLLAGYAVVVLLALMARVPALDRGVGTDRLARWHAMGGRYVVSLAVAHTLLIIWGYAVTAHAGLLTQTGSLLTAYPDVLMATVALGLLVGIGVASARAARRRLAYETWHAIHLYTYLAIALAFSHQFSTGADFRFNAGARWAWSVMYVVVAALLLWYRLIAPIRAAQRHQLRVVQVRRENADVVSVYVTGRDLDRLRAEPGQFFRWRFLTRELWWAANPYSLSAPPRPDLLRLTAKICGGHSLRAAAAAARHEGDRRRPIRGIHRSTAPATQGAAAGRRGRHHPAAGLVRDTARRSRGRVPAVPRQHRGGHRAARRTRPDRPATRRTSALPHRAAQAWRQRPPIRATIATTGPRPEPVRRVLVRARTDDGRRPRRPTAGRGPARAHPRRIVHPVKAATRETHPALDHRHHPRPDRAAQLQVPRHRN